eukprot:scaffold68736_cov48-Phaeocystis_antarctica.AAC.1
MLSPYSCTSSAVTSASRLPAPGRTYGCSAEGAVGVSPGSAGRSPLRTLTPYSCTAMRVATLAVARAAGSTPKTAASEASLLARPAMEAASLRRRASISSCCRCCLWRFCSAGTSWLAKAPRPLACRSLSGL